MTSTAAQDNATRQLLSATQAFDHLFSNDIAESKKAFAAEDSESPFHLLGLGVCAFLEAALGMETGLMAEATRCLSLSEAGSKKQFRAAKTKPNQRFQPGLEWEILHADAVILLGVTHALSESYMGYLSCMYSMNSAHSKFTKLYKTVFPTGLDDYSTPATSPAPSRKASTPSLLSASSASTPVSGKSSFFSRWGSSSNSSSTTLTVPQSPSPYLVNGETNGPVEEMIVAGTAFGYGLFNLVFSLLPKKVQSVVGFFGFNHDRKLALQALAVAAAKKDVHSVFAGLVLMTYYGVVLLLSGYQADEAHIVKQYRAIVDSVESRYPTGALWILNRAKILRMTHDAEGAIRVLQVGLKPERPHTFAQADTLLVFELAWCLLQERRYEEAAEMFVKITELNSWSHATYYFIAAGCYISMKNFEKAQQLLDTIPGLLEKKKIHGKDLPTEVLIRKKLAFYQQKQKRLGGNESEYVQAIKISPAEEIAIFWNTHSRISKSTAEAHIEEWTALTPAPTFPPSDKSTAPAPPAPSQTPDLDTPDELAVRSLLLGIVHRTAGAHALSRSFLLDAHRRQPHIEVSTWVGGVAMFELAVLELKEAESTLGSAVRLEVGEPLGGGAGGKKGKAGGDTLARWSAVLKSAGDRLDQALALATSSTDLSSRLDTRISMLRDEIGMKREMLGIPV